MKKKISFVLCLVSLFFIVKYLLLYLAGTADDVSTLIFLAALFVFLLSALVFFEKRQSVKKSDEHLYSSKVSKVFVNIALWFLGIFIFYVLYMGVAFFLSQ